MTYDIIAPEFQRKDTSAYQLSILVGMDSLVYSVLNSSSNQLLRLKTLPLLTGGPQSDVLEEIMSALAGDELLGLLYRRVKIAFLDVPVTLVPSRLYNAGQKDLYLDELSSENFTGSFCSDSLDKFRIQVIYHVADGLIKKLKEQFPTSKFYHVASPFLLGCREIMPEDHQESAFVHFYKDKFNLAILDKQELVFFNSFSYRTANDVLYYLLLALEQLGHSTEEIPVHLSGQVVEDSEIYKMLYRYIADLRFIGEPAFVKMGRSAESVKPHMFFDLYSMVLHA